MSLTIAIDGPAGSGKSTAARRLARRLNYRYLDTGAMYRAVTYEVIRSDIDLNYEEEVAHLAEKMEMNFTPAEGDKKSRIIVEGRDITDKLRIPEVNDKVSRVARIKGVREVMVKKQRALSANGGLIMDGRDIGSQVLPDADFKFYITATLEERARRRYKEIIKKKPDTDFEEIKKSVARRDKIDTERCYSPLIKPEDAVEIDTTDLSINEVVDKLYNIIKEGTS